MSVDQAQPPAAPRTIRIVIADDHAIVRAGLRSLLGAQPGMTVVGEAADGEATIRMVHELAPDVVVLDVSMPGMGGIEATRRLCAEMPATRILALTIHEELGYVSRMLAVGAHGYLLKRSASSELVVAIRTLAAGERYVDPSVAPVLDAHATRAPHGSRRDAKAVGQLTPRERETIEMVARGYSNKEIGAALDVSVKTVETHRANAMSKLGISNRAALVRFALDEGWLS